MPVLARADLEALLRTRKLDVTLLSARPPLGAQGPDSDHLVATGVAEVDLRLGGGVPRGEVSSIGGPPSSGRTSLVCGLLATATRQGELAALVDTRDTFDPESAAATGLVCSRLLWIRGGPVSAAGSTWATVARQVDRALKASVLVLEAGGFGVVVLDLADIPPALVRRLPYTTWLRLARLVEGRRTVCVIVAQQPVGRSAGGVTILLEGGVGVSRWSGVHGRNRLFRGLQVAPRVVSARPVAVRA